MREVRSSHDNESQQAGPQPEAAPEQAAHNPALQDAGDAVVRRLLAKIGIADGETPRASLTADNKKAAPGHSADDSAAEGLTASEQAAFRAGLAKAADPNLTKAVESVGIVSFMKQLAAGQSVGGINEKQFEQIWNNSVDEAWLKDKFRAADPGKHEWIPSNEIEAVVQRADSPDHPGGSLWIDLQNQLRTTTADVIFAPSKVNETTATGGQTHQLLQGHVGALYVNGVMQTKQEAAFHDELRAAFTAAKDIPSAIVALEAVMTAWMWKGEALPHSLVPGLQDSDKKPIDEKALVANRASVYGQITSLFAQMKTQFSKAKA